MTQRLADSDVVGSENIAILEQYFYEQLTLHASFAGIYLGLANGGFIYVSRNNTKIEGGFLTKLVTIQDGVKTTELIWKDPAQQELMRETDPRDTYDPRGRPWYLQAKEKRQTIWTEPYIFFTSKQPGVTTASPVVNADGELVGVVGVDVEIGELSTFLSMLKVGQHGRAFIMNDHGRVVAFPDLSLIKLPNGQSDGRYRLTQIDELDDILSRKAFMSSFQQPSDRRNLQTRRFGLFRHEQNNYHTMFAPFDDPQWPWIIGIYLPEDDYLGPIKRNRLLNIYIMIGTAILGALIGWVIVRSIIRPMHALQVEAQAIWHHDLDTTLDKHSMIKEIQETADSFEQMKSGLQTSRQQNAELTQSLQAQAEELTLKELHLRASLTSLLNFSDALIVLDQQQKIRFLNPAAEALMGGESDDMLGQVFSYPLVSDRPTEIEMNIGHATSIIAEMRVVDTEWEGQAALLVALRDITEHRRLELQLRQSQKMEAIGNLAGGIAHEFNNILNIIVVYIELAQIDLTSESVARRHLEEVRSTMQRAKSLIDQILAFSRQSEARLEPLNFSLFVEEVLRFLRASLPSTIELRQHLGNTPLMVLADATQLQQILMNLCANAEHAMRDATGVLTIELDAIETDTPLASREGDLPPGSYVRLTVEDTGHGIAPECQERIFEPFFTTKAVGEGTGMGLAMTHGIVRRHGGSIDVDSTPGEGTTFTLYLPRVYHSVVEQEAHEVASKGQGRILFVDDEEALTRGTETLLTRLGYDVVAHTNPLDALAAFKADPHRFDVVITDQMMPEMTGSELVHHLRRMRADIRIVLCTGFSHMMNAERAEALGIDAFCQKPLSSQQLSETIKRILT